MKILNPEGTADLHMHSINFSDGFNTIDELAIHAGKIWLKKIAITDHSQALIDNENLAKKWFRDNCKSWKNVHNDVEVLFGVEGDILNDKGDVCLDIQWVPGQFTILSIHPYGTYHGDRTKVTDAYINALSNNVGKIDCVWHPCMKSTSEHLDIRKLVQFCNEHKIAVEFNGKNLLRGRTDTDKLKIMLDEADQIYVNSDAHSLFELENGRKAAFTYLRENGYL